MACWGVIPVCDDLFRVLLVLQLHKLGMDWMVVLTAKVCVSLAALVTM